MLVYGAEYLDHACLRILRLHAEYKHMIQRRSSKYSNAGRYLNIYNRQFVDSSW